MASLLLRRAAAACAAAMLAVPALAQPTLVSDIRPGPLTSVPRNFQVMGGDLYFTAERSDVGAEPFRFNGRYVALATNIIPEPGQGSNPQGAYVPHKGAVYFVAAVQNSVNGELGLWRFDGTTTTLVWRGSTPSFPTSYNGDLYFVARHPTAGGGARVWRWDGRDNYVVNEIPQSTDDPQHLAVLGGRLYYTHDTDGTGQTLWQFTAGQAAVRVANASFTPASMEPRCGLPRFDFVQPYRGALYFTAPDHSLYRFDGTNAPAKLSDGRPRWIGGFGGAVYYTSGTRVTICGAHPQHTLWGYDGAARKVATLLNFGPDATDMGTGVNETTQFVPFRGALYYRAATDVWRFTGTAFERVSDVGLRGNDALGGAMGAYKGRLYFGLPLGEAFNEELFSYDGRGPVYQRIAALGAPAMSAAVLDAEAAALEAGIVLGGAVANETEAAAYGFGVALASANPAQGAARLRLTLPQAETARVTVYDALGRAVALVHDGPLAAGTHDLVWDGHAPAGRYVVRAEAGARVHTAAVVRVR